MNFRTAFNLPDYPLKIDYQHSIFSIGSCFASHIAAHLHQLKFQITENPFGILFNPISIANSLNLLLHEYEFSENDLCFHQGLWHSYHHHSAFSGTDKNQVLNHINDTCKLAHQALKESDRILITLGTAFVHHHKDWGGVVANCHKIPAHHFEKSKLNVQDVIAAFAPVLQDLKKLKPNLEILLSVSPVRHTKEGIIENQRSKATLILAAETLCQLPFVHYFPAYEVMMDDLRDYRFYANDLIHPSDLAIQYIWEKFTTALFTPSTWQQTTEIKKLLQAVAHRPIHPHSEAYQQFLTQQLTAIDTLCQQYPNLDFGSERRILLERVSFPSPTMMD